VGRLSAVVPEINSDPGVGSTPRYTCGGPELRSGFTISMDVGGHGDCYITRRTRRDRSSIIAFRLIMLIVNPDRNSGPPQVYPRRGPDTRSELISGTTADKRPTRKATFDNRSPRSAREVQSKETLAISPYRLQDNRL